MQARAAAPLKAAGKAGQAEDRRGADIAAGDRVPAIERQQHEAKDTTTSAPVDRVDSLERQAASGRALLP